MVKVKTLAGAMWKGRAGYLFIAPGYIAFVGFMLVPLLFAVSLSFYDASFNLNARTFVGFEQYRRLAADPIFLKALTNTMLYVAVIVPATIVIALAIALILDPFGTRVQAFFRGAFYLPGVAGGVILSVVWLWIFNPTYGLLNFALGLFGVPPRAWLANAPDAFWAVSIVVLTFTIGPPVILFLAGLAGIPQDVLDAATVDGAGSWQQTYFIRLPLLRPVLLFVLATQTIQVFQLWEVIFMLTRGGPFNTSTSLVFLIYQTAFIGAKYGTASAMGVVLLAVIMAVTLIQLRFWDRSEV